MNTVMNTIMNRTITITILAVLAVLLGPVTALASPVTCPFSCVTAGLSPSNASLCTAAESQFTVQWDDTTKTVRVGNALSGTGYGIAITSLDFDPGVGTLTHTGGQPATVIGTLFWLSTVGFGQYVEFEYTGSPDRIWMTVRGNGGPNRLSAYTAEPCGDCGGEVPEPGTHLLSAAGLGGLLIVAGRRLRK